MSADDFRARGVLFVPEIARLSWLVDLPEGDDLGANIDLAMDAVEGLEVDTDLLCSGTQGPDGGREPFVRADSVDGGGPVHTNVERSRWSTFTRSDVWADETAVRPPTRQKKGAAWRNPKDVSGVGAPTCAAAGAPLPPSHPEHGSPCVGSLAEAAGTRKRIPPSVCQA